MLAHQVFLHYLPRPAHPHTLLRGHAMRTLPDQYVITSFHLTFSPNHTQPYPCIPGTALWLAISTELSLSQCFLAAEELKYSSLYGNSDDGSSSSQLLLTMIAGDLKNAFQEPMGKLQVYRRKPIAKSYPRAKGFSQEMDIWEFINTNSLSIFSRKHSCWFHRWLRTSQIVSTDQLLQAATCCIFPGGPLETQHRIIHLRYLISAVLCHWVFALNYQGYPPTFLAGRTHAVW